MLKMLTSAQATSRVWVHKSIRSIVVHQITYFDPMRPLQNKDDILDIMAYMYKVIGKYMYDIRIALDMEAVPHEAAFGDMLEIEF